MEISYALTVYNKAPFLAEVLESIVAEWRRTGGEFIALDDGSTDGSREILLASAERHGFQVLLQDNQGVYAATNRLLATARGEWIRLTDSDDLLLPGSTEALLRAAQTTGAGVAYGRAGDYDLPCRAADLTPVAHTMPATLLPDARAMLVHSVELTPCQTFFHRRHVGDVLPLPEHFKSCQDFSLFLRLAAFEKFVRLDGPVALRPRDNPHNLSANVARTLHVTCAILLDEIARGLPTSYVRHSIRRMAMRCLKYYRRIAPGQAGVGTRLRFLALRAGYRVLTRQACIQVLRWMMGLFQARA